MANLSVVLTKKPGQTYPEVDDVFEVRRTTVSTELKDGELLVQPLYVSIDAAMRVWITGVKTYFDPVKPGDVMPALGVGRVVASKSKKAQAGDVVSGLLKWQSVVVVSEKMVQKIGTGNLNDQHLLAFLGPLGISGLTAWTGFENIGKPQPGEVVVVSAAAGAVGELAVQLAKHLYKCTVIGIAGGKEKCQFVKSIGADDCIDYKSENIEKRLKEIVPDGVHVYFDNVGGEQLDQVLMSIRDQSRIILCGAISQYNRGRNDQYRVVNYPRLIIKRAVMQGYIYTDYAKTFPQGIKVMSDLMKQGKLNARYDVQNGLENASAGLQKLLLGKNEGKVVVKVNQEAQPKL